MTPTLTVQLQQARLSAQAAEEHYTYLYYASQRQRGSLPMTNTLSSNSASGS